MSPYVFVFFIIISLILVAFVIYFQIENGILNVKVTKKECPKGCNKGKCYSQNKCYECDPYNLKCCCYNEQCQDCNDNLEEEDGDISIDNIYKDNYREKIIKQNEYIKKINLEIQTMNRDL